MATPAGLFMMDSVPLTKELAKRSSMRRLKRPHAVVGSVSSTPMSRPSLACLTSLRALTGVSRRLSPCVGRAAAGEGSSVRSGIETAQGCHDLPPPPLPQLHGTDHDTLRGLRVVTQDAVHTVSARARPRPLGSTIQTVPPPPSCAHANGRRLLLNPGLLRRGCHDWRWSIGGARRHAGG